MAAVGRNLPVPARRREWPESALAPFPGRLFKPIDGDPALRWKGVGSPETTMTTETPTSSCQRTPWNKGRLTGQKRRLKPKDVWTIRVRLQLEGRQRDLAMFNLAVDSKLRGCDLVRVRIDDVCAGGRVRDRATVIQKKTSRPVQFEITEQTRSAIGEWLAAFGARRGRYLFPSRFRLQPHLSTRQYARIVHPKSGSWGLAASDPRGAAQPLRAASSRL